jgi:hypothetical protein
VEELTLIACLSVVGLTFIAGQLLLQSTEEGAFWIFVSLMDSYPRPYFSSNAVQLDIDASLFAKATDTIDPLIAKNYLWIWSLRPFAAQATPRVRGIERPDAPAFVLDLVFPRDLINPR